MGYRTLLDRCIDFFRDAGFTEFVFLLGFGKEQVLQHLEERGLDGITAAFSMDPETGSGRARSFTHALDVGAIKPNLRSLITFPDDIFTDEMLPRRIMSAHLRGIASHNTLGTLVLSKGLRWPYGTAEIDGRRLITEFIEKPAVLYATSVGTYVFEPDVYDLVLAGGGGTRTGPIELEETLIPRLARMRKLNGIFIPSQSWLPVNTPKDVEEAEKVLARMNPQLASHAMKRMD